MLHWLATANLVAKLQNATHQIKVVTSGGLITISVDGTQVLSQAVTLPSTAFIGFSGGTGSNYNRQAIFHLSVIASP
jgi:hydroxymethylglutaryl-CoA reductase